MAAFPLCLAPERADAVKLSMVDAFVTIIVEVGAFLFQSLPDSPGVLSSRGSTLGSNPLTYCISLRQWSAGISACVSIVTTMRFGS
jgi:hypothetical protein